MHSIFSISLLLQAYYAKPAILKSLLNIFNNLGCLFIIHIARKLCKKNYNSKAKLFEIQVLKMNGVTSISQNVV